MSDDPRGPRATADGGGPVTVVAERWASVGAAWREPNVRRGLLGTVLITGGALSPAYLPRNSPWWRWFTDLDLTGTPVRLFGTLITMAGLLLLVDAWFRLRPRPDATEAGGHAYSHLRHWAILAIWGTPFLFAPPIFSHDAYSYAAQGWLIHNGINPYDAGPAVLPGAFADQVSWVWRETPAPYGPLSLQLQHLVVDLTGFHPYAAAVAMRTLALIGVGLIGLLIPRIARRRGADPAVAAWFATLNPVLVIDFIGGAHNDSLMLGLVVAALWVTGLPTCPPPRIGRYRVDAHRWGSSWWLLGAVIIGVAAAIKQPAILAAYALPLMVRPWADWSAREVSIAGGRMLASIGIAIGTFSLVTLATGLGFGWINAVNVPGMVMTIAPFTVIGQGIQLVVNALGHDPTGWAAIRASRTAGVVLAGVAIAVLAVTVARRRPMRFLALGYLIAALALPAVRSWYILWGGVLLPLTRARSREINLAVWVTVVLLCYNGINMSWRNDTMALGFAAAAGIWWLAHTHQRLPFGAGNPRRRLPGSAAHLRLRRRS